MGAEITSTDHGVYTTVASWLVVFMLDEYWTPPEPDPREVIDSAFTIPGEAAVTAIERLPKTLDEWMRDHDSFFRNTEPSRMPTQDDYESALAFIRHCAEQMQDMWMSS